MDGPIADRENNYGITFCSKIALNTFVFKSVYAEDIDF